eukprot:CAMPEP_0184508890 /NCGR_PEP_ID=MMETSP0198_2-20121128/995_1 /TAXON_ID=1112570 /ORGANISM="Thraustochytrium sp., Strain LLF1b" /LENGTH=563 /DNA_ID=CAMNT_0026898691 /DNA_START=214 /DNA_END=1905 /DNA_ORIENTATION=-
MAHSCHDPPSPLGFVPILGKKSKSKSKKRKKNRVDYYGYDPSINVIEGDPRLSPPPAWFGVNYHPSQPISNSWLEWSGADSAMFDISRNQMVPVNAKSSIIQDSNHQKRQRRKANSMKNGSRAAASSVLSKSTLDQPMPDTLGKATNQARKLVNSSVELPTTKGDQLKVASSQTPKHDPVILKKGGAGPAHNAMQLHPFQPTRNEWSDWHKMEVDEEDEAASDGNPSPSIKVTGRKATVSKKSIGVPSPATLAKSQSSTSKAPPTKYSPFILDLKSSEKQETLSPEEVALRNKNMAKLYRMRQFMYLSTIENQVAHLKELIATIKGYKGQFSAVFASSIDPVERKLNAILCGDSTMQPEGSHEFCDHPKKAKKRTQQVPPAKDGFDPVETRKQIAEDVRDKVNKRRITVAVSKTILERKAGFDGVGSMLLAHLTALETTCFHVLMMRLAALHMDALPESLRGKLRGLQFDGLSKRMVGDPNVVRHVSIDYLKILALKRIVRIMCRLVFMPQVAKNNEGIEGILTAKQMEKLLYHVAHQDKFVGEIGSVDEAFALAREVLHPPK